jgi:hypothetical protein
MGRGQQDDPPASPEGEADGGQARRGGDTKTRCAESHEASPSLGHYATLSFIVRGRGNIISNFGLRIANLKARIQNSGGKEQREWGQRTEDRKQMKLIAVSSHRLYYSQAL